MAKKKEIAKIHEADISFKVEFENRIAVKKYISKFVHRKAINTQDEFERTLALDLMSFGQFEKTPDLSYLTEFRTHSYRKQNFMFEQVKPNVYECQHNDLGLITITFYREILEYWE